MGSAADQEEDGEDAEPSIDLNCKDCEMWYGADDDGYGPCSIKHGRGDEQYITHGVHDCDETEWLRALEVRREREGAYTRGVPPSAPGGAGSGSGKQG